MHSNDLTIQNTRDAVKYLRNEDNRMQEDDYLFYDDALKIVCAAALKWCEYSDAKDSN